MVTGDASRARNTFGSHTGRIGLGDLSANSAKRGAGIIARRSSHICPALVSTRSAPTARLPAAQTVPVTVRGSGHTKRCSSGFDRNHITVAETSRTRSASIETALINRNTPTAGYGRSTNEEANYLSQKAPLFVVQQNERHDHAVSPRAGWKAIALQFLRTKVSAPLASVHTTASQDAGRFSAP